MDGDRQRETKTIDRWQANDMKTFTVQNIWVTTSSSSSQSSTWWSSAAASVQLQSLLCVISSLMTALHYNDHLTDHSVVVDLVQEDDLIIERCVYANLISKPLGTII